MTDRKSHWENIFRSKSPEEVSWTQEVPETSLLLIRQLKLPKTAEIIDVGGGDSKLADHLLDEGYTNITVLDISGESLEKAKHRLGYRASLVNWIVSDILDFNPIVKYDLWHDRAAFHFLTGAEEVRKYVKTATQHISGYLTIATFSDEGPDTCSGLSVKKYTEELLQEELSQGFKKVKCIKKDHYTPFQTRQNFLFCTFKKFQNYTRSID
jgi:SAM-dependent methyltransferase